MNLDQIITKHHSQDTGFSRHYLTLYSIILGLEAKNVFEFGCGFSTKTILEALKQTGGKLTTCDMRPIVETGNSQEMIDQNKGVWTYVEGNSLNTVPKLNHQPYDCVLHDGSHEWRVVAKDLRFISKHVKNNGIILVHDTMHIPTFRLNLAFKLGLMFKKYEKVTLPYGYGLTIIRILGNKQNGSITTTWRKQR